MYGHPLPPVYGQPPPILLIIAATTVLLVYILLIPKIPDYKIEDLSVKKFNVGPDKTIETNFILAIRAENPNTKISLNYGNNNEVTLSYEDTVIGKGNIPAFTHGQENVTMINVWLSGKTQLGSNQVESFHKNEQQGKIPLQYEAMVPISVNIFRFHLKKFTIKVTGDVTVDSINPDKKPKILSTTYEFNIHKFFSL
ncbi:hypothetical protein Cgig2_027188 [Carnegiea gigantea]|uniref:Late embryogenesis abundant protein LEA-2 subgroup domain-containing protein n=1 Tax=Carnegiea gigantea TaxID=171969 RepID=A0A9Q1KQW0_9CARY|nr:hypothetical protein Cgig2_027188 [Carnegiea gigantea]